MPSPWVLPLSLGWAHREACASELKVSVLGRHGGWEGWRAEGKTGLTVTYTDVTGHPASPWYRFPHGQASAEFRGAVTSHPWLGSQAAHCIACGAAEVSVALTSTA